jgi:hypothetical protein
VIRVTPTAATLEKTRVMPGALVEREKALFPANVRIGELRGARKIITALFSVQKVTEEIATRRGGFCRMGYYSSCASALIATRS